ncbi:5-methylcytosine restriction system specificity protein McrC [Rhodobacter maris]|uniref:McrBC 5-methylcytosine restriction system component n=1 Tax=Rhodobacter maris TaxID=446682 RepID=A0A285SS14_9RHOB|nr:hypothetical protein [Rhodobacter maris]SOC11048.1 McrBC 5-methylcytosine restriction system component [Rhodobacter maris]
MTGLTDTRRLVFYDAEGEMYFPVRDGGTGRSIFKVKPRGASNRAEDEGTALLFEMDALFEQCIGRLIRRAVQGSGHQVALQGGGLYCLEDAGRGLFRTRPDILIRRAGQVVQVIDTKWKRIAARIDDPKQGVSQADVYQMMAYAQLYRAPRVTRLSPHYKGLAAAEGVQARFTISGYTTVLETASVDVGLLA